MSDDRRPPSESEPNAREFLAEAEEILEGLSGDLRDLETAFGANRPHLDQIHTIFRRAHSLKGFAGLLGYPEIASLTHALEDLLARLRLGGRLDGTVLDLLHETLDALNRTVRRLRPGSVDRTPRDLAAVRDRLSRMAASIVVPGEEFTGTIDLPEDVRSALTEHEEKRLSACASRGLHLELVRVRPDPQRLEQDLQDVAQSIALAGELISTLPVTGEPGPDILLDLLVASARPLTDAELPQAIVVARKTLHVAGTISDAPVPAPGETPDRSAPGGTTDRKIFDDLAAPASSLRVPVVRLDELLANVGELSMAMAGLERGLGETLAGRPQDRAVRTIGLRMQVVLARLRALQRGAIDVRLVPLENVFRKIGRIAARMARTLGKEVDLRTIGADTEIDKSVMDILTPPLMHLVVNAIDHGIESPAERTASGKPPRGRLVLSAFRRGASVVIDVNDDGRGLRVEAIRSTAVTLGGWPADRPLTMSEASDLIFRAGVSTAPTVSEVSGRGVGMDVVRRTIRDAKGTIVVRSVEGMGTTFTVTVPISLALVPAIIVRSSGQRYAIPVAAIRENIRLDAARVRRTESGSEIYERPQGALPLVRLERLLSRMDAGGAAPPRPLGRHAIVAGAGGLEIGIVFDDFVGRQEVVVKPIGRVLGDLPGVAGAADLGDATAVLVLDPSTLVSGRDEARAG